MLKELKTPAQIQDFINKIPVNFDYHKDTCMSPRVVLRKNKCHCIEGAILAALCLRIQGYPPLILHLKTIKDDYEHVIAVFQQRGFWGAISKTNHGVLRYREPIYKDIRELVMSYFHEYTDKKARKTLRSYSVPLDLSIFDNKNWVTDEKDLWYIDSYLDKIKHYNILNRKQIKSLRKADRIEIKIGAITEYKYKNRK
ncbi:MAG: hypothetical protein AABW67_00500 [Nanoarchaeota archaeon]